MPIRTIRNLHPFHASVKGAGWDASRPDPDRMLRFNGHAGWVGLVFMAVPVNRWGKSGLSHGHPSVMQAFTRPVHALFALADWWPSLCVIPPDTGMMDGSRKISPSPLQAGKTVRARKR